MTRLDRLMAELLLLQERRRTGEEIARLLEVSKRTVIRDMQALCEIGIPVLSQDGVAGGYELASHYTLQPPALNAREAMLMMLAVSSLARMSDSPFSNERASLQAKLKAMLTTRQRKIVEQMLARVEIDVPERTQRAPHLEALMDAVAQSQWIRLRYASADGDRDLLVRPDRVFADRGLWYLDCVSDGEHRMLRVDRVLGVELAEPPGAVAEPLPYDHPSHPEVVVRLTARGLREVEREPHLGRKVVGRSAPFTLRFRCPPRELAWYARYFGSMGSDALVESPPELVEQIRCWASAVLDAYP